MKKITILLLFFSMTLLTLGAVSTRVCLSDGNTPLELADPCIPFVYRDVIVGTKLTIIVDSNVAEYWSGALAVADANRDYGLLSGRDFNETTHDWEGSRFPAAGVEASVLDWEEDPGIDGFTLYTGFTSVEANDWFIIDYNALEIGDCNVGFYDHDVNWFEPIYYLTFSHVPTPDIINDNIVNFLDFAVLASYWQATDCNSLGWCQGTDLDIDGDVDFDDLMLFVEYWLEKTR